MRLLLLLVHLSCQSILHTLASECCKDILLDDVSSDLALHKKQGSRLGFYTQLGEYEAKPFYRQLYGNTFLFYSEEKEKWIDSMFFAGSTYLTRLENNSTSKCVEDHSSWSFYNNTKMEYTEDLSVNCTTIKDVCCDKVRINSSSAETGNSTYGDLTRSFGVYTAIGKRNGRYIYQMDGKDIFLEFEGSYSWSKGKWLVTTGIGKTIGKIRYNGGSICPEHVSSGWQIYNISSRYYDSNWKEDPEITVTCEEKDQVDSSNSSIELTTTSTTTTTTTTTITTPSTTTTTITTTTTTATTRTIITPAETRTPRISMTSPPPPTKSSSVASSSILSVVIILLLCLVTFYFVMRFRKARSLGAHGTQLWRETFLH